MLRQYGELEQKTLTPPVTRQRESELKPIQRDNQEEYAITDVDKLLEDIPDGSEVSDLGGLQSLLNEDVELKELLVDVFSSIASVSKNPQILPHINYNQLLYFGTVITSYKYTYLPVFR